MPNERTSRAAHLLLVEDDGYCRFFLDEVSRHGSTETTEVSDVMEACRLVEQSDFDAIIVNLQAFARHELSPLALLRQRNDQVPVLIVCDKADVDFAVEVIRAGAFDYLTKPFNNVARVEKALEEAFAHRERARQASRLGEEELRSNGIMGRSKRLADLLAIIAQIAPLSVNILIEGDSGTGKELVARAIHEKSNRSSGPFLAVNCGALPEGLIESILFGHEKGAFTGATQAHPGFLEKAHSGTLFLDEVGELSPRGQVALLRFLEEREFVRVGGNRPLHSDARIVASSHRNLEHEVSQHRFRADLHFRLNVVHLKVPRLSERREDIVYLARYFARRFCLANRIPERQFSPQALRTLEEYNWPGNVRELQNLIDGLMAVLPAKKLIVSENDILSCSDKMRKARHTDKETELDSLVLNDYREALKAFEIRYLRAMLDKHRGNVTKAAQAAGIHPVTFHRKLRKLGVVRQTPRDRETGSLSEAKTSYDLGV